VLADHLLGVPELQREPLVVQLLEDSRANRVLAANPSKTAPSPIPGMVPIPYLPGFYNSSIGQRFEPMTAKRQGDMWVVAEVVEGSMLDLPFEEDRFDLVVSLDVIEHLEDDLGALRELRRVVAPGGSLLGTVPAYQWLWSGHDEINHHHRRYTRCSLQRVAEQAGSEQVRTTYFNTVLLPVAILLRLMDRLSRKTTESSVDLWVPPGPMNWLLERPLALEAAVIARGGRMPVGLSLLAVFR
jgi:SAM-dependent methyltransferase